jgi:hypothetical protein
MPVVYEAAEWVARGRRENILLHDGAALVADFRIALAANQAATDLMTDAGNACARRNTPRGASDQPPFTARLGSETQRRAPAGCLCSG